MQKILLSSYNKVLKVNLTTDSYSIISIDGNDYIEKSGSIDKLSVLLSEYAKNGFIYSDDVLDFNRYTSIEYIRSFFKSTHGESTFWLKYRRRTNVDGEYEYHWSVMRIIADGDYSDENQKVIIFIDDIEQSYKMSGSRLENVLLGICSNYESIYYVDIEANQILPYRLKNDLPEAFKDLLYANQKYEEVMKSYISTRVHAEDQQRVLELSGVEHLQKVLKDIPAYSFDYKLKNELGNGWFRMRIAKLDNCDDTTSFAVGFEDITEEKHIEDDYFKVGKKVLIVEDSDVNRSILMAILEDEHEVLEAVNGEEAYTVLEQNADDVAVILTDLEMPVCNGYDFISKVRANHKFNSIPIIVTTANSEIHVEVKCLKLGASDFVTKPYNPEVVRHRVRSLIKLKESTAMLNTLEKDALTGLYSKEFFYQRVSDILGQNPDTEYHIFCTDIENFKVVNEKYGNKTGDDVLAYLAEAFAKEIPGFVIGGRLSGDLFAGLRKDIPIDNFAQIAKNISLNSPVPGINVKYGIYHVDRNYTVQGMCDRALLAVESIKGIYGEIRSIYDDKLRLNLLKQQQILDNMETALLENQFKVYFQPKHDLHSDKIGGAEALIRWIHPEYGFMNPGEFIPLFEQNGFIRKVDAYVCRQVCETMAEWKRMGIEMIPVSINLSRRDFEADMLAETIIECADKNGVPHDMLHIEITESAFSDNPEHITEVVKQLHDAGFIIELDDFGSGYSSLTTLSTMDIDILKLDMSLIRKDDPSASRNALEFSMQLAHMMNFKTVSEGVETKDQMERIKSLGGDYIQGYFYSKPLPQKEFEEYMLVK